MSEILGRVFAVASEDGRTKLIVASGGRAESVLLASGTAVPAVGAFIRARVAVDVDVADIEVLSAGCDDWSPEGDPTRWWNPFARGTSRMDRLWARARAVRALRATLDGDDFLETQAPLLVRGTCPDVYIDSFRVGEAFLTTSTEYHLKRLFVGGFERIYSLIQNFRRGDVGAHHNPEFTMLEWARAFASLDAIERDAERLVQAALAAIAPEATSVQFGGREIRITGATWERLTVRDALAQHLGLAADADLSLESLQREVKRTQLVVPPNLFAGHVDLLTFLLDHIQPRLGAPVPTFLVEWPAVLTTSAPLLPDRPTLAARSELFIAGVEIADGFPFLRDAALQERLFGEALKAREALGKETVTLDAAFLAALQKGLPPGAGMALGVDRLVMLLTGAAELRAVLPFADDER